MCPYRLIGEGRSLRYAGELSTSSHVLLTNAPVTADQRIDLAQIVRPALPLAEVTVWGGGDVCDILDSAPQIRAAWPQLLGLADLQHILGEDADLAALRALARTTFRYSARNFYDLLRLPRLSTEAIDATVRLIGSLAQGREVVRQDPFRSSASVPRYSLEKIVRRAGRSCTSPSSRT